MATVCAKVLKHHLKADGTYNVKIRIFHKNEKRYIDTDHYVTDKQLSRNMAIKDPIINRKVNQKIDDYRIAISDLGEKLEFFSAEALRDYLANKNAEINFIQFCDDHIRQLKKDKRDGTASNQTTVRNSLVDFYKREKVSILELTAAMLKSYARFLRSKRTMTRINHLGKEVTTESAGLTDSGLYNHMRDLRTLFNAARDKYNDEDLGIIRIPHYPFKKYKIGSPPETEKRNITIQQVNMIRDSQTKPGSRAELAKELFMLSFFLCGMNAVDLYNCTKENIKKGRLVDIPDSLTRRFRRM
ncbi:phage integrase SAM-like domain-containing protein [uncultured Mucilaginibacter sp.]|uniref:phage integrase SAM-like domain-containing protein n=1 Tax=uncultured Mucilaginibacter sp. TaxID=797541 RepID=UPI0025FA3FE4|nr:phage integrase SAM-like domain-containing protein [uncultured Mucilaginibacter sp.]